MKIRYELTLEIEGPGAAEMAARSKGSGEILRKWENQIRATKITAGNVSARAILFEEISKK